MNAQQIKQAANDYNSEYPEAAAEIEAGTATLLINARYADNYGRKVLFVLEYGVRAEDGGWIGSGNILDETHRSIDGRIGPDDQARKRYAKLIREAQVPVEVRRVR